MRLASLGPVGLLMVAVGCSARIPWHADLDAALAQSRAQSKPLYVLSVFGDLSKKC